MDKYKNECLGVRWDVAKSRTLKQIIADYYQRKYYVERSGENKMSESLREFAEEQFEHIVEQAKKSKDWQHFYISYQYK